MKDLGYELTLNVKDEDNVFINKKQDVMKDILKRTDIYDQMDYFGGFSKDQLQENFEQKEDEEIIDYSVAQPTKNVHDEDEQIEKDEIDKYNLHTLNNYTFNSTVPEHIQKEIKRMAKFERYYRKQCDKKYRNAGTQTTAKVKPPRKTTD